MGPYIIVFLVILLIPVVGGVIYFTRRRSSSTSSSTPSERPGDGIQGEDVKNGTPVTLDRNPEMPKMPGATS